MAVTVELFKSHIHFEDGMDETMLPSYLGNATRYVENATGTQDEYCILLVAGIMYEYRVSEKQLEEALNAITPFMVQAVFSGVMPNEETPIQ